MHIPYVDLGLGNSVSFIGTFKGSPYISDDEEKTILLILDLIQASNKFLVPIRFTSIVFKEFCSVALTLKNAAR